MTETKGSQGILAEVPGALCQLPEGTPILTQADLGYVRGPSHQHDSTVQGGLPPGFLEGTFEAGLPTDALQLADFSPLEASRRAFV